MPTDHNSQGRRGHFHRGRRGPDQRGPDRRQVASPEQANRGERVDVDQIMREIRARISQRSGIELSNQQIQELAARRLEAILDPRGIKPGLLDQLRRTAGERAAAPEAAQQPQPYTFEEATLYDSDRSLLRFIRRLLNPILRLFFNPTPLAHTLALQARWNAESSAREAGRDRRQSEWNALHFEMLQRLVTEVSRASLEAQSLSLRIESLGAKVDFNERRVRSIEGAQVRPAARGQEPAPQQAAAVSNATRTPETISEGQPGQPVGEGPRRRRRRRRGRRGAGTHPEVAGGAPAAAGASDADAEPNEGFDDESVSSTMEATGSDAVHTHVESAVPLDHRLPEPQPYHEEPASPVAPPTPDSDPGAPEQ